MRDQADDEDRQRELDANLAYHAWEVRAGRRPDVSLDEWLDLDPEQRYVKWPVIGQIVGNFESNQPATPTRAGREGDTQPLPKPATGPVMHELLIEELPEALRARLELGKKRYGQPLQAFNGRNPHVDAMEEALDLLVYMRQARIEAQLMRSIIERVASLMRYQEFGYLPGATKALLDQLEADIELVLGRDL